VCSRHAFPGRDSVFSSQRRTCGTKLAHKGAMSRYRRGIVACLFVSRPATADLVWPPPNADHRDLCVCPDRAFSTLFIPPRSRPPPVIGSLRPQTPRFAPSSPARTLARLSIQIAFLPDPAGHSPWLPGARGPLRHSSQLSAHPRRSPKSRSWNRPSVRYPPSAIRARYNSDKPRLSIHRTSATAAAQQFDPGPATNRLDHGNACFLWVTGTLRPCAAILKWND
jgi:hypothetical protein